MAETPLILTDFSVDFRDTTVLHGLNLKVPPGRRTVLVGENGVGKSTLLRAIAGKLPRTARTRGVVRAPSEVLLLRQEPPFRDDSTVAAAVELALRPMRRAVAEVERLAVQDPESAAYADALQWAVEHDAWDAERRTEVAAQRLGVDRMPPDRLVADLSGGERTRLALATVITLRPECLLLDEPTNHLDDAAIEVLAEFLRSLPGVVLCASHDRVFIDEVATDLVDLDPNPLGTDGRGGTRFASPEGGCWTAYVESRAAARRRWQEAWQCEQEEIAELRTRARTDTTAIAHNRGPRDNDKFIYGFKGQNVQRAAARRSRDAQRRLDLAERSQLPKPPRRLAFDAGWADGETVPVGRLVLLRDVAVTDRLALPELDVLAGERVLVTGANGSGKSTLLGVLAGRVHVDSGTVQVSARQVSELSQEVRFEDLNRSVVRTFADLVAGADPQRTLHELGLFRRVELNRPVGALSQGQRRRLGLAVAIASHPDLLLLDEPTNHLSLSLVDEMEQALDLGAVTVVAASHDRWLRRRWRGRELALA